MVAAAWMGIVAACGAPPKKTVEETTPEAASSCCCKFIKVAETNASYRTTNTMECSQTQGECVGETQCAASDAKDSGNGSPAASPDKSSAPF